MADPARMLFIPLICITPILCASEPSLIAANPDLIETKVMASDGITGDGFRRDVGIHRNTMVVVAPGKPGLHIYKKTVRSRIQEGHK